MNIKQYLKPEWRRIILFVILFLVLPQKITDEFIVFGGVYIIKSLFESEAPKIDLITTVLILVASYLLACFIVWAYDKKINKFIANEGEVEVEPPEENKGEKTEQQTQEAPKEESK